MFDFLKKLFGKKQEPVKQSSEPKPPVQASGELRKQAAEPVPQKPPVSKYTDQNRPGVVLEIQRPRKQIDDYPGGSTTSVQPPRPTTQPIRPVVKPPVKQEVKYQSKPAWTADQKPDAAKPAVSPAQTKPRPQVVAPGSCGACRR